MDISQEKRQKIKKGLVNITAVFVGVVIMLLIFMPKQGDVALQTGFNVEVPDAENEEITEDKQQEYQKTKKTKTLEQRQEFIEVKEDLIKEQAKIQTLKEKQDSPSPKDNVVASTKAYKDASSAIMNFYQKPKVDTEKLEMQRQLSELKAQLDAKEQPAPSVGVDEQLALLEKSYQIAAKYMPGGTIAVDTPQEPKQEEVKTKEDTKNVSRVTQSVVSSLSALNSDASFTTAVGALSLDEKNTISACIHTDQTIIDAGTVKLRLLEDMMIEDFVVPKNEVIVGYGKVSGERLSISINNVEYKGMILPVELSVIDSDAQRGIFIPNSMELDAFKEVVANLSSSMGTSIDINQGDALNEVLRDLGEGAIDGVSEYVGKKIKQKKVHLKTGYKVMLLAKE